MRKPIIIGNWKMNMSINGGVDFLKELEKVNADIEVGIACQSISLIDMKKHSDYVLIGAQNVNDNLSGAYTGELSAELLEEAKIDFCIIGHSERRQYYNESDEAVNKKAKLLLDKNIMPVICVGETLEQYEKNQTREVIEKQISIAAKDLDITKCVIAYEPVWAIGTGKSATSQIAQDVCKLIRTQISSMYSEKEANEVRIQYGGSVNPENIKELMSCLDIDGALVGGASLKIDSFEKLITY
ncbi:triosephosphate isomerase [Bacilli bacterium PM5-3]|nr:triosephosphate isomerase [Bacilli bacterium PM5-3]MDH6603151.1 triosephosphate isomerase [Bacilli bacterium PM5-9]